VLVSNDFGVAKSHGAYLEVRDPNAVRITQQPYSEIVTVGDPIEFNVKASGNKPFTYQWSLNGTILPQAKSATYRIEETRFQDEGVYKVLVQNA
tara:strand:+ start:341 stop:622 length:282 start_codon:yes stop_codon:yes gene_type:complete